MGNGNTKQRALNSQSHIPQIDNKSKRKIFTHHWMKKRKNKRVLHYNKRLV